MRRTWAPPTCAASCATSSRTPTGPWAKAAPVLFNSYGFLFCFLPIVLAGWWGLGRRQLRLAFLTGASWFFYAWWDWRYLPVLIAATSVDYVAGLWISRSEDEGRRRLLLAASLSTNIGILAYFKYAGFFVDTLNG